MVTDVKYESRLLARVDIRVLPMITVIYVLAFLDRLDPSIGRITS